MPLDSIVSHIGAVIAARSPVLRGGEWFFHCPYPDRHAHGDALPSALTDLGVQRMVETLEKPVLSIADACAYPTWGRPGTRSCA